MEKIFSLFTSKPVEITEKDDFFKKSFRYVFAGIALVMALFGIYSIISVAIEYFKMVFELEAFQIIRHLILFIICLIVSLLTYVFIAGAFYQRSRFVFTESASNLIDIMPGVFKTLGIVTAIVPVALGVIALFSAILAATPYFPLNELNVVFSQISFIKMPELFNGYAVDGFESYIRQLFSTGFMSLIYGIISGFINLVCLYLVSSLFKLVVDFLRK
ncbi:MAG: hypothetical protein PHE56_07490 [Bacteroidales bacterium]|nr:hypothetical protein [Bacteroidales bacterium]